MGVFCLPTSHFPSLLHPVQSLQSLHSLAPSHNLCIPSPRSPQTLECVRSLVELNLGRHEPRHYQATHLPRPAGAALPPS